MNDKIIREDSLVVSLTAAQLRNLLAEVLSRASPPIKAEPEIIDIQQLSSLTGYSVATLYKLVHERKIPFYKPPGARRLFFVTTEIYEWLKTNRVESNSEFVEAHKAGKTGKGRRGITSAEAQEIRNRIKQMRGLLEYMRSDAFMARIRTTPPDDLFFEPEN